MATTYPQADAPARGSRRRWWGLLVILLGQLMVVADATIMNIALPSIQDALDISAAARQWVITAYTLAFAGLLLLGGRIADYVGRKRAILIALAGLAVASVLGGASVNVAMLLAARAAQGVCAALLAPTVLSLVSTMFPKPRERATAFAMAGAVLGSGLSVGLTLGGVVTAYLGWHWVFYINVPVAAFAALGVLVLVDESRERQSGRFDVAGAVLATAGLITLAYGFSAAASPTGGWQAPRTVVAILGGAGLLAVFVLVEARVRNPLLPLRIVAHRSRGGALLAVLVAFVGLFGLFLFTSLYLQDVAGYTPLQAGVAALPLTGGVMAASVLASRLMTRLPPRLLLGTGMLLAAVGMGWLTQLQVDSGYVAHVLPALLAGGLGLGAVLPTTANLVTFGVADRESGAASAALNATEQMGASLGTALLNTIAANATAAYLATHQSPGAHLAAQVDGYTRALACGAGILTAAGIIAMVLVKAHLGRPPRPVSRADKPDEPAAAPDEHTVAPRKPSGVHE